MDLHNDAYQTIFWVFPDDKTLFSHCNSSNLLSLNFKQYRQACSCVPELTTGSLATIAASAESTLGSGLEDVKPHLALPLQPSLLLLRLILLARAACAEGRGTKHSVFQAISLTVVFFLALQKFNLVCIQHRTLQDSYPGYKRILDFSNTNLCIRHIKSVVKMKQGGKKRR